MTQLTPEQLAFIEAVKTKTEGIRLDAVAGSGKTTTLLQASRFIDRSFNTIALAFNKNTAEELGKKFPSHIQCKTLNSVGNGIWYKQAGRRVLDPRKMGTLTSAWCDSQLSREESKVLWNPIRNTVTKLKSLGYIPQSWEGRCCFYPQIFTHETVEYILESNDDTEVNSHLVHKAANWIMMQSIAESFSSCIDFDDQIYMATYFSNPDSWPRYDIIMVDEAQDLSQMQHDMIERLGTNARVIVAGDPYQAIYGWRGASCHSLDELSTRFNLITMPLTVSFRCPQAVVDEAKKIVPHIQAFKSGGTVSEWKREKEDTGECTPWDLTQFTPGNAILCRNNAPLIRLGFALIRAGIPCFFTGRDIGAGLKKIVVSLEKDSPPLIALEHWFQDEKDKLLQKKKYDAVDRLEDKYEALCAIYKGAEAQSIDDLLKGIDKLFMKSPSPDAIELSTIHKAKGREWDTAYFLNPHLIPGKWIADAAANGVPGAEDLLTQEENLRYVGITRALSTLIYFTLNKDERIKGEHNDR